MNAASAVDEAQSLENAVQDVAHAALCEGGLLQELAHVDLVQVEHEPNVGRRAVATKENREPLKRPTSTNPTTFGCKPRATCRLTSRSAAKTASAWNPFRHISLLVPQHLDGKASLALVSV